MKTFLRTSNLMRTNVLPRKHFSTKMAQKVNTEFLDPIEDFNFDTEMFSRPAIDLASQPRFEEKEVINRNNQALISKLQEMAGEQKEDPFALVVKDLETTKEFAMKNILKTNYK